MATHAKFSISWMLLVAACVILLLGLALRVGLHILERERWRVDSSEQEITAFIRRIGGVYGKATNSSQHIVFVSLANTKANDQDVEVVLQLKYLKYLDVTKSEVTDASLDKIFGHPQLRLIYVKGSGISDNAVMAAIKKSGGRISREE